MESSSKPMHNTTLGIGNRITAVTMSILHDLAVCLLEPVCKPVDFGIEVPHHGLQHSARRNSEEEREHSEPLASAIDGSSRSALTGFGKNTLCSMLSPCAMFALRVMATVVEGGMLRDGLGSLPLLCPGW